MWGLFDKTKLSIRQLGTLISTALTLTAVGSACLWPELARDKYPTRPTFSDGTAERRAAMLDAYEGKILTACRNLDANDPVKTKEDFKELLNDPLILRIDEDPKWTRQLVELKKDPGVPEGFLATEVLHLYFNSNLECQNLLPVFSTYSKNPTQLQLSKQLELIFDFEAESFLSYFWGAKGDKYTFIHGRFQPLAKNPAKDTHYSFSISENDIDKIFDNRPILQFVTEEMLKHYSLFSTFDQDPAQFNKYFNPKIKAIVNLLSLIQYLQEDHLKAQCSFCKDEEAWAEHRAILGIY